MISTDRIPDLLADAAADVGQFLEGVPEIVEDGVATGVGRTRGFLAAVPWIPVSASSGRRRWWITVGVVGVVAAVVAVWLTRRSSHDSSAAHTATGTAEQKLAVA